MNHLYSHAAIVLQVSNIENSTKFYCESLDFEVKYMWGEPASYVVLSAGDVNIHLSQSHVPVNVSSDNTHVMIFTRDVDASYRKCHSKEVRVLREIGNREYQMRDFDIMDPDGYVICFGQGV